MIKKDLSTRVYKNLIFRNEINIYNGMYGTQQSLVYKQQLDYNTYDIQDSYIYLQNPSTEIGSYFTVQ
jgi:hypothetical protein